MALAALFSLSSCPRLRPGPHDPEHPRADTRRVLVCLHALSSFQRTDRTPVTRRVPLDRSQGNLLRLLPLPFGVKPFSFRLGSSRSRPPSDVRLGNLTSLLPLVRPCQPPRFHRVETPGFGIGKARGRDEKCSGPTGASGHRRCGGSPPRQKDNIRSRIALVNPSSAARLLPGPLRPRPPSRPRADEWSAHPRGRQGLTPRRAARRAAAASPSAG
jgi:hypothetical protein